MKARLLAAALFLLGIICIAQQAQSQLTLTGVGGAFGGAAAYVGPADISSSPYALWSTRCGSTSYTGNVVDIWDTATGNTTETLITCSAGGTLNQTVNSLATTCATACSVKTWYDQVGTNCTSGCNFTNTVANLSRWPGVNTNCQNSKICLTFNGTGECMSVGSNWTLQNQPVTISTVYKYTNSGTQAVQIADGSGAIDWLIPDSGGTANVVGVYANGAAAQTATASDNANHAVQVLVNGASTSFDVDGSTSTPGNPGAAGLSSSFSGFFGSTAAACSGNQLKGNVFEFIIWGADKTANNSTMNSNQHSYWSF